MLNPESEITEGRMLAKKRVMTRKLLTGTEVESVDYVVSRDEG